MLGAVGLALPRVLLCCHGQNRVHGRPIYRHGPCSLLLRPSWRLRQCLCCLWLTCCSLEPPCQVLRCPPGFRTVVGGDADPIGTHFGDCPCWPLSCFHSVGDSNSASWLEKVADGVRCCTSSTGALHSLYLIYHSCLLDANAF